MQPLAGQHDAGLDQLLVVVAHLGQELFARHDAGLRIGVRLDHHHDAHLSVSFDVGVAAASRTVPFGRRLASYVRRRTTAAEIDTLNDRFLRKFRSRYFGRASWRARSTASLDSKSSNSNTWRSSMTLPSSAGQRVAQATASSFDFTWISQYPPITSFAS